MKTVPSWFVSVFLSLTAMVFMTGPASAASEPAKPAASEAAAGVSDAQSTDTQRAEAKTAPAKEAVNKDAVNKDDTTLGGGKLPKPADVARSSADKGTPQRFTPSEQVRPDFDVSFPIDI